MNLFNQILVVLRVMKSYHFLQEGNLNRNGRTYLKQKKERNINIRGRV